MPAPDASHTESRIRINKPLPLLDCGRYAPKRCVGDTVDVSADIFRDGHEIIRAVVRYRPLNAVGGWVEAPMHAVDAHHNGVRWAGSFRVETPGRWEWSIEAWSDLFSTWRDELQRKINAGQHDLTGELSEGALLIEDAAARTETGAERTVLERALDVLRDDDAEEAAKFDAALAPDVLAAVDRHGERHDAAHLAPLAIEVDRVRARFSSWYELVPRSWGGLKAVEGLIPEIAAHGFDVLYMLPIHPIGRKNRKGPNNALEAGPDDPGSPYAIGAEEGGHDAVHPELGTMDDVRSLCATAREHGMDVCLDLALNASADHPWLTEHPEWFQRRPDGTLKYAENPPKRYQDIYNFNWDTPAWESLWEEWRRIILLWVQQGVKVFRVDNPHTKPFAFWEWLIAEIHAVDRDVIFLAEAFTRRSVMRELAKLGFTQGYTYFTWKNSRWELVEYVNELAWGEEREYFRPNFFPVTPDILHAYLQHGGPPAFVARLVLAATLSPSYGVYSGYERFENVAVREGSEEYLDSEKYQLRADRSFDGPLLPMIRRLNEVRRENVALQHLSDVHFLETYNDALVAYAKQLQGNTLFVAVSLDPHNVQEGVALVPAHLGLPPIFTVEDQLTGEHFDWRIGENYLRLDPQGRQTHLLRVVS